MVIFNALPPELYEVINCAIATTSLVALIICLRYLATQYVKFRGFKIGRLSSLRYTIAVNKLAIGFTILLCGEFPRMSWVWLARYLSNTGQEPIWMGAMPYVAVPIIASLVSVVGMACVVRALVPRAWGRWGYAGCIISAAVTVILTQIFR